MERVPVGRGYYVYTAEHVYVCAYPPLLKRWAYAHAAEIGGLVKFQKSTMAALSSYVRAGVAINQ